jgi:hypothetical protein
LGLQDDGGATAQRRDVPITPFHFGPGALLTVATRRSASFLAFCAVNVLIDVESLYNMLTDQPRIHTFFHTYIGATVAAAIVSTAFVPARWLAAKLPAGRLTTWRQLHTSAVGLGAAAGAWSHVLLDSIMHGDIAPLAPFSDANGLYRVVPLRVLHLGCLVAGVLALAWWALRRYLNSERGDV